MPFGDGQCYVLHATGASPVPSHTSACSRGDLPRPLIGRDRSTIPTMASNRDGPVRRDQTSDLQLLVDSAPSLIHTSRPDGYLDFFNQTWLTYIGRPLEDLQGWKWTAFIHPEDVEEIVEKWRASLASGEPFLHEARVLRADGEYRWMLHHKVAARDGCSQIVKWYGSSIDIEDRKRAEVQLRR